MSLAKSLPINIDTYSIEESLRQYIKESKKSFKDIDFCINKTVTKVIDSMSGESVMEVNNGFVVDSFYMDDANYSFKQLHSITIFSREPKKNSFRLKIFADTYFSSVNIVLSKDSKIIKDTTLSESLYSECQKLLGFSGIVLYQFDAGLQNQIDNFAKKISLPLKNDIKFVAARSIGYKKPTPDEIDFLYKKNKHIADGIRTTTDDLYDQNYIKETKANDILVEYIKAKDGISGRNCKGTYLEALKAEPINEPKFEYDEESVYREEFDDKILYVAKKDGFVDIVKNVLLVGDRISVQKITAKETGTIRTKEAKEARVDVLESNPIVDAIGPSMSVNVAKLRVNGSVANDAKLFAKEVEVFGVTHATSYILADNYAKIKNHRGIAESKYIEVSALEGGIVNADNVTVDTMHSGIIRARNVKIKNMHSNCVVMASETITIEKIIGEENDIYINPSATFHSEEKILLCQKNIRALTIDIKKLQDLIYTLSDAIKINKTNVEKIMQNKPNLMSDIQKTIIARFKDSLSKLKQSQEVLEIKKESKKNYVKELEKALYSVFTARVVINGAKSSKQTIRFLSIDGKDYFYTLKTLPIMLKIIQTPSEKYEIVKA